MKTLLLSLTFIYFGMVGFSQNWALINQNRTVFFQHSDSTHITNTIVVDSTEINGANTNYFTGYAFKYCDTCQGFSYQTPIIYRYAKELLGFHIEDDATNNQFNLDDNVIKHHSELNDTWLFNATLNATVVNASEVLILGVLDSIKTIELSNNDNIIISKNYGVIRYPDFENTGKYYELVGYHEEQNSYGEYLPNLWRTYDFSVGDVFCYHNSSWSIDNNTIYKVKMTILENLSQNDTIKYVVKKLSFNEGHYGMSDPESSSHSYSSYNFTDTISIVTNDNFIENCYGVTQQIAEVEYSTIAPYSPVYFYNQLFRPNIPVFNFLPNTFFPISEIKYNDSLGFGKNLKLYEVYSDSLLQYTNYTTTEDEFFNNYGRTIQYFFEFEYSDNEVLIGAIKNGDTTGTIYNFPDDLGFDEQDIQQQLNLFPNPANTQISIPSDVSNLKIYSNLGQLVLEENHPHSTIDVSELTKGLYFVIGEDTDGNRLTSKLIISD